MNKKRTLCFLLLLTVVAIVLGGSYASAAGIDETINAYMEENTTCNVQLQEYADEKAPVEKKNMACQKSNVKSADREDILHGGH